MPGTESTGPRASGSRGRGAAFRAAAGAAAFLLVGLLLAGCLDQRPQQLVLAPAGELHMSSSESSLLVRNLGGRVLDWRVSVDDPRVSVTPSSGRLYAGGVRRLRVDVDTMRVDKAESLSATLMFTSNGGDAQMLVSFTTDSGIGRCAGHLPYELPLSQSAAAPLRTASGAGARPVGNEILVAYRTPPTATAPGPSSLLETTARVRADLQDGLGLALLAPGAAGAPDLYRSGLDPDAIIALLLDDPRVLYAQRNYYLEPQRLPDDPLLTTMQWNLMRFGLPEAWEVYDGAVADREVVIAVLDSGVYGAHPDLSPKLLAGWDFHGRDPDTEPGTPADGNHAAHGTHVAGIAAALGDDGVGVAGVAHGPAIRLLPVKVFDDVGEGGTVSSLVDAIRWSAGLPVAGVRANDRPAAVINMSLGVPGRHPALEAATLEAWNAGALLVAAAGNHNDTVPDRGVLSPGNAPCVIAVGSVDEDLGASPFSNTGPQVELVAPGGYAQSGCLRVYSTVPPTRLAVGEPEALYGCLAGTSMAAPFVAGVAALVIGHGEVTSPAEVRTRLSQTALATPAMADLLRYGNGLVCADAALGAATRCGAALGLADQGSNGTMVTTAATSAAPMASAEAAPATQPAALPIRRERTRP